MKSFFESAGGRKLLLVAGALVLAALNEIIGLGISKETTNMIICGAVGGSGTIALEDGLKAMFAKKEEVKDA